MNIADVWDYIASGEFDVLKSWPGAPRPSATATERALTSHTRISKNCEYLEISLSLIYTGAAS